jgi:hypothetical protein
MCQWQVARYVFESLLLQLCVVIGKRSSVLTSFLLAMSTSNDYVLYRETVR